MKEINEYTIEEILDEYQDVVEDILISEYYSQEKAIARLIATAIAAGVSRNRHDKIEEIIERTFSRRYQGDKVNLASNYEIMREIIKESPDLISEHYPEELGEGYDDEYCDTNDVYDGKPRK